MADNIPRFGASDFWLVQTDAAQLREQLRSALETVLGRPVVDSDPHMVLASAFLPFLVQGQASADAAAKATLRAFAVGADLDRIADSTCVVGYLDRRPARPAVLAYWVSVTITRPSASFTETAQITCELSREVPLSSGERVVFAGSDEFSIEFAPGVASLPLVLPVYALCDVAGSEYNGLLPISTTAPVVDTDATVTVSVQGGFTAGEATARRCGTSYNGSAVESDESFAQRTAWQAKALRVPGSYEYFLLALSDMPLLASTYVAPAVDSDGRIVLAWCDKCGMYASMNGITLSDRGAAYRAFYEAVRSSLLVEQRAIAHPAERWAATYIVTYWLPAVLVDEDSGRAEVERAWTAYLDGHAWTCGAVLSSTDIDAALSTAGASRVDVSSTSPSYSVLPADAAILDTSFTLVYAGRSTDSAAPEGTDGEEIAP